ncbi:MAG: hypothetical protein HZT41_10355 [Dechloromonas sp.]|nr:MAG: hypothetical protein HZT41_10355 [Dechloromonas sp.]
MKFLTNATLALTPLAPIHIGCGEDFEPTNYVIEDDILYGFDPSRAALPDNLAKRLGELGDKADLLGIQRFFRDHRGHFQPHADVLIPVAAGLGADYERQVGQVANRESNGNRVFNQLFIERASHTGKQPYIPGSSFKGHCAPPCSMASTGDNGLLIRTNDATPADLKNACCKATSPPARYGF